MAAYVETKETAAFDKYDGSNFPMWKMYMSFIFQSKDLFSIVDGSLPKHESFDPDVWERKDKSAAVAILSALSTKYKSEVAHCRTSAEMWSQLLTFHERNSAECIVGLQEKFYKCRLEESDSVISYISTLQNLARQLTELGEVISERQVISKIRSGLPPSFDSFLLAWDSVPLAEQTLRDFQSRLVKREDTQYRWNPSRLHHQLCHSRVQRLQRFYSVGSLGANNKAANVSQVLVKNCHMESTTNGVRIKTWQSTAVEISLLKYKNITGTSATAMAINLACSEAMPCTEIRLKDINITHLNGRLAGSVCINAFGVATGLQAPPNCLAK